MSIEELKSDYAAVTAKLRGMNPALTTAPELAAFLQNEFMPLQENLIGELAEIDETVHDLYSGAEDILQPETAQLFAAVIAGAMGIITSLKGALNPQNADHAKVLRAIKEWEPKAIEAGEVIEEITIPEDVEETDDDADDEDEDLDGEDDDDDAAENENADKKGK